MWKSILAVGRLRLASTKAPQSLTRQEDGLVLGRQWFVRFCQAWKCSTCRLDSCVGTLHTRTLVTCSSSACKWSEQFTPVKNIDAGGPASSEYIQVGSGQSEQEKNPNSWLNQFDSSLNLPLNPKFDSPKLRGFFFFFFFLLFWIKREVLVNQLPRPVQCSFCLFSPPHKTEGLVVFGKKLPHND